MLEDRRATLCNWSESRARPLVKRLSIHPLGDGELSGTYLQPPQSYAARRVSGTLHKMIISSCGDPPRLASPCQSNPMVKHNRFGVPTVPHDIHSLEISGVADLIGGDVPKLTARGGRLSTYYYV